MISDSCIGYTDYFLSMGLNCSNVPLARPSSWPGFVEVTYRVDIL